MAKSLAETSVPAITVVIPTFNSRATLELAVRSVLRQSFTDIEIWVIGDGCTDDSEAALHALQDPRVHWYNRPTNSGAPGEPYKEGLRRAHGRYVAYLGHDDLWLPWHLEQLFAGAESTGAEFVYDLLLNVHPDGSVKALGAPPEKFRATSALHVPPSAWLHLRSIVPTIAQWGDHRQTPLGIDWTFWNQVLASGRPMAFQAASGVLKFPSAPWRHYAPDAPRPQAACFAELIADPEALERRLLLAAAIQLAGQPRYPNSAAASLVVPFLALGYRLGRWYGFERWPVSTLLYWRHRYKRPRRFRQRGLLYEPNKYR